MSRSWNGGSTRRWRRIRARVLADNLRTNGGQCTLAIPGTCTGAATQVHHLKGRAATGDDPKYLAPTCRDCNLKVGNPAKNEQPTKRISNW